MIKKEQMRWSQEGAHWLLLLHTRVFNAKLRDELRFGDEFPKAA